MNKNNLDKLENELKQSLNKEQARLMHRWIIGSYHKIITTDKSDKTVISVVIDEKRVESLFAQGLYRNYNYELFKLTTEIKEDKICLSKKQVLSLFNIIKLFLEEGQSFDHYSEREEFYMSDMFKFCQAAEYFDTFRDTLHEFIEKLGINNVLNKTDFIKAIPLFKEFYKEKVI